MKAKKQKLYTILLYVLIFAFFMIMPILGSQAVSTLSNKLITYPCVIVDAGHGGIDGGAVSCSGVRESEINLQIALKLEDLLHLLGVQTLMIRDTDRSVHIEGQTIAAKKVSDIRERVRIANATPNAFYLSIHQNQFSDPQYFGAQVFYNSQGGSREVADLLQTTFRTYLDPNNKRQSKNASGIYIMEHINCSGILVECGFLSNPMEESRLRDENYQKKLCCVMTATICQYLNT